MQPMPNIPSLKKTKKPKRFFGPPKKSVIKRCNDELKLDIEDCCDLTICETVSNSPI